MAMNYQEMLAQRHIENHFWGSNLSVKWQRRGSDRQIEAVGISKDGAFKPYPECSENNMYVFGYVSEQSDAYIFENLNRIASRLLKDRLNSLLEVPHQRNFCNGGTYESGYFVDEAIIYTPYVYHGGIQDYQAIFTFGPARMEREPHQWRPAQVKIRDAIWLLEGMSFQESSEHYFDHMIKPFSVTIERDQEWVRKTFEDIIFDKDRRLAMVMLPLKQFMEYIEVLANLIKLYYYKGKTYTEYRLSLREAIIQSGNGGKYEQIGLYHNRVTLEEYYVMADSYTIHLYHTKDHEKDTQLHDRAAFNQDYLFIEGKEVDVNV